jgi:hypothetical protein
VGVNASPAEWLEGRALRNPGQGGVATFPHHPHPVDKLFEHAPPVGICPVVVLAREGEDAISETVEITLHRARHLEDYDCLELPQGV